MGEKQDVFIRTRVSRTIKNGIDNKIKQLGISESDYIRYLIINDINTAGQLSGSAARKGNHG